HLVLISLTFLLLPALMVSQLLPEVAVLRLFLGLLRREEALLAELVLRRCSCCWRANEVRGLEGFSMRLATFSGAVVCLSGSSASDIEWLTCLGIVIGAWLVRFP